MAEHNRCTVSLPQGAVVGSEQRGGVRRFLGIRYAEPPIGALRFRPPVPIRPSSIAHDATRPGPACPQHIGPPQFGYRTREPDFSEDCLRLDVWTPAPDRSAKPVLVWIHGGAFLAGSTAIYSGAHLARTFGVVVVALQYRLGVFGFVDFGSITGDAALSSNLGLRDQQCALAWVRANIADFGGDPGRITIAGESAGSMSVSLQMLHRASDGLYQRAIMQSGAVSLIHDRAMAARVAKQYADVLSLRENALYTLRTATPRALLRAQAEVQRRVPGTIPAAPWFDGDFLPGSLSEAHATRSNPVPLIAGFNRDEMRLFDALPGPRMLPSRAHELRTIAATQLGAAHADRIERAYGTGRRNESAYATHATFGMPTLHFAERHLRGAPTWFYRFDMAHPLIGAAHAQDLLYLWEMRGPMAALMRGGRWNAVRKSLAQRMQQAWCSFVRDGDPGVDWPRYELPQRLTRLFDRRDSVVADPEQRVREIWAGADFGAGLTTPFSHAPQVNENLAEATLERLL